MKIHYCKVWTIGNEVFGCYREIDGYVKNITTGKIMTVDEYIKKYGGRHE